MARGVDAIIAEFEACGSDEEKELLHYVLHQASPRAHREASDPPSCSSLRELSQCTNSPCVQYLAPLPVIHLRTQQCGLFTPFRTTGDRRVEARRLLERRD